MAAKTPDSVRVENIGSLRLIIAKFVTNDIDDNDTWASGVDEIVGWPIVQSILDGPQDCTVDAISGGTLTFGSAANQQAYVYILAKG